jgi:hypothetical protein
VSLVAALLLVLLGLSLGSGGVARGEEPAGSGQALSVQTPFIPTAGQLAPSPDFVLYGVIIVDQRRSALLAEPGFTEGRIRRVVLGTQVGPYRVSRIEADGVLLETDGLALRVPLGGVVQRPAPAALADGRPAVPGGPAPIEAAGRTASNPAAIWHLSQDLRIPVRTPRRRRCRCSSSPSSF